MVHFIRATGTFLGTDGISRNIALYGSSYYFAPNWSWVRRSRMYRIYIYGILVPNYEVHDKQSLTIVRFTRATGTFWVRTEFEVQTLHMDGFIFCGIGISHASRFYGSRQAVVDNSAFYSRHRYFLRTEGI